MRLHNFTLAAAAVLIAFNARADGVSAPASDSDTVKLRSELDELREKLAVIERKAEIKAEDDASKSKTSGTFNFDDKGIRFDSPDKKNQLRIRGLLQADYRAYFDDDRAGVDKFVLRRARPIIEATLAKDYDVVFVPEFGDSPTTTPFLLDAYVNAAPFGKDIQLQIGKTRSTIGYEMNQSDSRGFFTERSLATQLVSNRDLGAKIHGETAAGIVQYSLGVFNGAPDGASPSYNGDFDDSKSFAGFLNLRPFANSSHYELSDLTIGFGADRREKTGSAANTGLAGYKTAGSQNFFTWNAADFIDGESLRYSPYIGWYAGPFGLIAEYVVSETAVSRPVGTSRFSDTIRNRAWNISGSWVITGENATYKGGVVPEHPVTSGGFGAWQVVARYDELKIDGDAFANGFANAATSASDAKSYAVGLNWFPTANLRFTADYFHTDFNAANPTSALLRRGEDAVIVRAQVEF